MVGTVEQSQVFAGVSYLMASSFLTMWHWNEYLKTKVILVMVIVVCALIVVIEDSNAADTSTFAVSKHRTRRTLYGRICPTGCASCSSVNGCITCHSRHFLHVQRTRRREIGVCVASCPIGHVGVRLRHYSHCAKCRVANCDVCLTKHYCTRCQGDLYEHRGQCVESCPDGLVSGNSSRDCLPKVDCVVGDWGSWGVCAKNGRSCGSTFGVQTRVRRIVQFPSSTGRTCPKSTVENRKCLIDRPVCPEITRSVASQRKYKKQHQNRKNSHRKKYKYGKGILHWRKRHRSGFVKSNGRKRMKALLEPEMPMVNTLRPSTDLGEFGDLDVAVVETTEISNLVQPMIT